MPNKWIPCRDRLPEKNGTYLVTTTKGNVRCANWHSGRFTGQYEKSAVAWQALPEPYTLRSKK